MRLINTKTLELCEFSDSQCPDYAILSHTWDTEEVGHGAWLRPSYRTTLKGFTKIKQFCDLALHEFELDYAWVDTCCIDKSSSADLSEAINSMYRYYEEAVMCIVYMSDVPAECNSLADMAVGQSRWFTRGWTLQELIAPRHLVFYGTEWDSLGAIEAGMSPVNEVYWVANYTGVPKEVLNHTRVPTSFSVATRMAWASTRQTTRPEDQAYCLLGIFDVSLPLIYGEGEKAFLRLQEEIIKRSVDHSIFAWRYRDDAVDYGEGRLLARSPKEFRHALLRQIVPLSTDRRAWGGAYSLDNLGLQLPMVLIDCGHHFSSESGQGSMMKTSHAILNCRYRDDPSPLALKLSRQDGEDHDVGYGNSAIADPRHYLPIKQINLEACSHSWSDMGRIAVIKEAQLQGVEPSPIIILREAPAPVVHNYQDDGQKLYLDITTYEPSFILKQMAATPEGRWSRDHNVCLLSDDSVLIAYKTRRPRPAVGFWFQRGHDGALEDATGQAKLDLLAFELTPADKYANLNITGTLLSDLARQHSTRFAEEACHLQNDKQATFCFTENIWMPNSDFSLDLKLSSNEWMGSVFATLTIRLRPTPMAAYLHPARKICKVVVGDTNVTLLRPLSCEIDGERNELVEEETFEEPYTRVSDFALQVPKFRSKYEMA